METKHTPGPWKIHHNIGHKNELGIIADNAPCIIAIMGNQKEWPKEAEANANLIAAAPELLEACKFFIELYDESQSNSDKSYAADSGAELISAAIAKAE
jgi:hypothetical protein